MERIVRRPDGRRLRRQAGSRVPNGWTQAITPLTIGPCVASCGTAAFLKQTVITSDVANDPLSSVYRDFRVTGDATPWTNATDGASDANTV
jgi:hypothetical protein